MATYKLNYLGTDGSVRIPVGKEWDGSGEPFKCRHMTTARAAATGAAQRAEADVAIIRESSTNAPERIVLVAQWDGSFARPPATTARAQDDCKRGTGTTCFCPACRAERRNR